MVCFFLTCTLVKKKKKRKKKKMGTPLPFYKLISPYQDLGPSCIGCPSQPFQFSMLGFSQHTNMPPLPEKEDLWANM